MSMVTDFYSKSQDPLVSFSIQTLFVCCRPGLFSCCPAGVKVFHEGVEIARVRVTFDDAGVCSLRSDARGKVG